MWLNIFITGFASLSVGFILGWVMGRPRRWDHHGPDGPVRPEDDLAPLPTPYRIPPPAL